ncbi:MAG: CBS domain-containing protein [Nitrososphaeraceae archaeon]|jgi:CBS domain-containing protein
MATTSIAEVMTQKLETIKSSASAQDAAKRMSDKRISSLVVTDETDIAIGIVTERDLVRRICVHDASSKHTIVEQIMSSALVTIDADSQIDVAADIMLQNNVRHLLVIQDNDTNKPVGIITPSDFVGYLKDNLDIDDVNARIIESMKDVNKDHS